MSYQPKTELVNGRYQSHHLTKEEIVKMVNQKLEEQGKFLRSAQVTALIEVLVDVLSTSAFKQHPAVGGSEYYN